MQEAAGNLTVDLPPDGLVNFNFAITVVLGVLAIPLHGIVLLPVLLLKRLRTQPYQHLYSNYLLSSLAVLLGVGFYREVQIGRYIFQGYEAGLRKTACNITKFFDFPLTTSNFCLVILGFEQLRALQYNNIIDRLTLLLFIAFPWALGIYRHAFKLNSDNFYQSIPYLGMCIDVTEEKRGRMAITLLLEYALPLLLTITTISVAYAKTYCKWKQIKTRQKDFHNLSPVETRRLTQEKRSLFKIIKITNLVAAFCILRLFTVVIFQLLYSKIEGENFSHETRDRAGVAEMFFILLDVNINPILFFILNSGFRKAICDKMPMLMKIPLIYPDNEEEDEDEALENDITEMEDITEQD